MSKEIAVFMGATGRTATINEMGVVVVFLKVKDKWEVVREMPFFIEAAKGIKGVRSSVDELVKFLNTCKIFVGREITGLLYNVLDINGIGICEMRGIPEEFLDYIIHQDEEYEKSISSDKEKLETMPHPIESKKEGYYSINLKLLSINSPNITSKQALIPFLSNNDFYELEVTCGHVPRWFETELFKLNLKHEIIKESNSQYRVIIYHKTCNN